MKIINGILSTVLSIIALYLMFTAKTNIDLVYGFGALLISIIFMCFMIIEEQKQEVERLRKQITDRYSLK